VWDYHVLLFAKHEHDGWCAWDLDTTLGWPVRARDYLERTFPPSLDPTLAPRFRVLAAADYRARFGSDRRHMRSSDGGWLQPPPPWPAIGTTHELPQLLDTHDCTPAPWLAMHELVARYR
jgi:protein N-terminal glutamine amidohydrolase